MEKFEMNTNLYEKDFYAWTIKNAELMRQGKLSEIDIENIAEELESMGRSEKRQLINRLAVLVAHLLKWKFQPGLRSRSWEYTIKEQRRKVISLLKDSPSLKQDHIQMFAEAYEDAVLIAAKETGIDETDFPKTCPYSFQQAISNDFWPD